MYGRLKMHVAIAAILLGGLAVSSTAVAQGQLVGGDHVYGGPDSEPEGRASEPPEPPEVQEPPEPEDSNEPSAAASDR